MFVNIDMKMTTEDVEPLLEASERLDSYVVNDDVETCAGNKIPLWLFGFLY